jgi:hypothetical protein
VGKGGGGGKAGQIDIPQALGSNPGSLYYNAFQPLGTFGSSNLSSLGSLTNWAEDIATGGNVLGNAYSQPGTGMLTGIGSQTYAPFTSTGTGTSPFSNLTSGAGGDNSLLGPILSNEQAAMGGAEANIGNLGTLFGQGQSILSKGQSILGTGTNMVDQARNKGLFPSQQAEINQAVSSQQAAINQQLSNEGLGSSTVNAGLQGQAKMSGAAAAGQLIQGNIQLGESEQQIGEGEQQIGAGLSLNAQQAMYSQFMGIANQSQSLQAQMYSEALQGEGELGQMMNATLQPFGYSMQTQQDVLQANTQEATLQTNASMGAASASAAGFSSLMGGLGSLLGGSGSGGGTGGLLGSLGSSLGGLLGGSAGGVGALGSFTGGGISGALGAGGAAAGAAGGAGGLISGIGSALGALFCEVARTVYGVDSTDWLLFRDWILFRAPKPVRTLYVIHAYRVSRWIRGRLIVCSIIKWLMNGVLYVDSLLP